MFLGESLYSKPTKCRGIAKLLLDKKKNAGAFDCWKTSSLRGMFQLILVREMNLALSQGTDKKREKI